MQVIINNHFSGNKIVCFIAAGIKVLLSVKHFLDDIKIRFVKLKMKKLVEKKFNESLITKLREEVNNRGFVFFKYRDVNGKSHWNAICSCMDWLTVSVRSINGLGGLPKDIDEKSIYILSLISYIDIIDECITTLHSVLSGVKGRKSPFIEDKSVFKGVEGKDDNLYFKELRARFGAHPVNLQDSKSGERHFASWPHDSLDGYDLTVMLYTNVKDGKDRQIHLNKSDLIEFASKRVYYLDNLTSIIQEQYQQFTKWCKTTPIAKEKNPVAQVKVLLKASKNRLDSEYIEDYLQMIKNLLPVSMNDERFLGRETKFRLELCVLLDEIYEYLQNGHFGKDLEHTDVFSTDELYKNNNYVMGKLMSCLLNNKYDDALMHYYFDTLTKLDKWGYGFSTNEAPSLTLMKVFLMNNDFANK